MEEFRLHEEKMKAFQENKKNGGKPPIQQSTAKLQNNENQPPIVIPKIKVKND